MTASIKKSLKKSNLYVVDYLNAGVLDWQGYLTVTQQTFTSSKLVIETPEKGLKYVQC